MRGITHTSTTKFVSSKVRQFAYVNPAGCTSFFPLSRTIRALRKFRMCRVCHGGCVVRLLRMKRRDKATAVAAGTLAKATAVAAPVVAKAAAVAAPVVAKATAVAAGALGVVGAKAAAVAAPLVAKVVVVTPVVTAGPLAAVGTKATAAAAKAAAVASFMTPAQGATVAVAGAAYTQKQMFVTFVVRLTRLLAVQPLHGADTWLVVYTLNSAAALCGVYGGLEKFRALCFCVGYCNMRLWDCIVRGWEMGPREGGGLFFLSLPG